MLTFSYKGGIAKPKMQTSNKFLAFSIVGGQEVPLYRLQKEGLITRDYAAETNESIYLTSHNVIKLFMMRTAFGEQRMMLSLYMRLVDGPAPMITVKPFAEVKDSTGFEFRGKVEFLRKKEIFAMLDKDSDSYKFLSKLRTPSISLLKTIITVDKSELRKGVRHVRI